MRINKVAVVGLMFICALVFSRYSIFAQGAEAQKSEIYPKLKCCSCKDSLKGCLCPEAKQMKAYIDALIESGVSKDDILFKVAKKFSVNVLIDKQSKQAVEERLRKDAGQKQPQLALTPLSFNLGKIARKQGKISKVFKLYNKGNAGLVIRSIKTSCPCAIASLAVGKKKTPYFGVEGSPKDWQEEIKPSQNAKLELVIDLGSPHIKTGKIIREVLINSNDPVYPEAIATIEAEVGK